MLIIVNLMKKKAEYVRLEKNILMMEALFVAFGEKIYYRGLI